MACFLLSNAECRISGSRSLVLAAAAKQCSFAVATFKAAAAAAADKTSGRIASELLLSRHLSSLFYQIGSQNNSER